MRTLAWLAAGLCALSCADGATPTSGSRPQSSVLGGLTGAPGRSADASTVLANRVMATSELRPTIALLQPHFRDAPAASDNFAALEYRDPAESLLVQWASKHLTWEELGRLTLLDAEAVLAAGTSLRGLTGCLQGSIQLRATRNGGREFALSDSKGRTSGGWLVGGTSRIDSVAAPLVCGIIVGAQGERGLRIVGLLEGGIPRDRGSPLLPLPEAVAPPASVDARESRSPPSGPTGDSL